jgi:hypothetical protein
MSRFFQGSCRPRTSAFRRQHPSIRVFRCKTKQKQEKGLTAEEILEVGRELAVLDFLGDMIALGILSGCDDFSDDE